VLETLLAKIQKFTVMALGILVVVVVLSTVHLGALIAQEIRAPPRFLSRVQGLLEIFGYFLLVLIGAELLGNTVSVPEEGRHSCARCPGSCADRYGA
jgi:hypothetical protein